MIQLADALPSFGLLCSFCWDWTKGFPVTMKRKTTGMVKWCSFRLPPPLKCTPGHTSPFCSMSPHHTGTEIQSLHLQGPLWTASCLPLRAHLSPSLPCLQKPTPVAFFLLLESLPSRLFMAFTPHASQDNLRFLLLCSTGPSGWTDLSFLSSLQSCPLTRYSSPLPVIPCHNLA